MRDSDDKLTSELPELGEAVEKRGRGRPKKEDKLSARQRTSNYRSRLRRASIDAIGFESEATTRVLLARLAEDISLLENPQFNGECGETIAAAQRNTISKILDILRDRYVKSS